MAFAPDPWVVGALSAVEVGLILYGDVLWVAMMQSLVPKEMLGRVSSLVYLFAFALGPLGILAGGAGAAAIGTRPALFVSGTVSSAICVIVVFIPGVRDPDLILGHDDGDIATSLEANGTDGAAEVD
jgi:hypothetical protein